MADFIVSASQPTLTSAADTNRVLIVSSNGTVTVDIDKSGLTEGFAGVYVSPAVPHDIGTVTAPLKCDVDSGAGATFRHAGSGTVYYQPDGDDDLCINYRQVGPGSTVLLGGGTVTNLNTSKGSTIIASAVTATNAYITGGYQNLQGSAATVAILTAIGGVTDCTRTITTLSVGAAASVNLRLETRTIGTWTQTGGTTNWFESGDVTTLNYLAGLINVSNLTRAVTITNLFINLALPGAQDFLAHPLLTITNTTRVGDDFQAA